MDVLSEVLDICRSERAVTARFALTAPWSLKSTGVTGAMIRMARGAPYWIQVEGMPALRVEPGDLVMLPLGALLTSVFVGWIADRKLMATETGLSAGALALWRFLVAWLCPIAVAIVLVTGLFPAILG